MLITDEVSWLPERVVLGALHYKLSTSSIFCCSAHRVLPLTATGVASVRLTLPSLWSVSDLTFTLSCQCFHVCYGIPALGKPTVVESDDAVVAVGSKKHTGCFHIACRGYG